MIKLMQVFFPETIEGGGLYFTTPRAPNQYDKDYWESRGNRVVFLAVDPVAQTAEVLKVGG